MATPQETLRQLIRGTNMPPEWIAAARWALRLEANRDQERRALVAIINAANATGFNPCHYQIRGAIDKAREVLRETEDD